MTNEVRCSFLTGCLAFAKVQCILISLVKMFFFLFSFCFFHCLTLIVSFLFSFNTSFLTFKCIPSCTLFILHIKVSFSANIHCFQFFFSPALACGPGPALGPVPDLG